MTLLILISTVPAIAAPPAAAPKPAVAPKSAVIPKAVPALAANAEDCTVVDPVTAKADNAGGDWKVALGTNAFLDFGADKAAAGRAADVIRHYHFTRECFVRRPNASMMYWRNGVAIPPGNMPGEDCIALHPETVAALYNATRWKVMDGKLWLLDYGQDRAAALEAAKIIHTYSLDRECFIARPHVVMQYWLAE
ncbi:MAG TPA: hypothetical protein VMD53_18505 [Rhizomicrobium sp.]|nr:hypothetical protein [Rhizomicrobium sp.]